jgi:HlyD family secretion protein
MSKRIESGSIEKRSEEIQEIITQVPSWIMRSGMSLTFLACTVILTVSCFIRYPDKINASVTITTFPSPSAIVTRNEGNLVLLKSENQSVKKGDKVAYIKSATDYNSVVNLEKTILSQKIPQRYTLGLGELEPFVFTYINASENKRIFTLNNTFNKQLTKQKKQVANHLKLKSVLTDQYKLQLEELKIARAKYERDSLLYVRKEEAQGNYLTQKRSLKISEAAVTNNDIEIVSLENEIIELQAQNIERQAKIELDEENAFRELVAQIALWKEKYLLITPIDGYIAFLGFHENESYIKAGTPVFSIIPDKGQIYGQAELPIAGSGKVKEGQEVNIKLESYPFEQFGMLTGKVASISAIPKDEKYLIKIALKKSLVTTYNKKLDFKQQLKGTTEIITEDLMLMERMFYQLRSLIISKK